MSATQAELARKAANAVAARKARKPKQFTPLPEKQSKQLRDAAEARAAKGHRVERHDRGDRASGDSDGPDGPHIEGIRLISKTEVLARVGVSFPTLWLWMREGRFPLSRDLGGSSAWIESEVTDWIESLPVREYKPYSGPEPRKAPNRARASV